LPSSNSFLFGKFTGTIPTEVGLLGLRPPTQSNTSKGEEEGDAGDLEHSMWATFELALGESLISGRIPSELGLIKDLVSLQLDGTNLEGTIPEELIQGCTNLYHLSLGNTALSGTLSSSFGVLSDLSVLGLENNNFRGRIPSEFAALTNLVLFMVYGNLLTGSIPDALCFENNWNHIGFSFEADCLPTTITSNNGTVTTGEPAMVCLAGCCSMCCDAGTRVCLPQ
jgi:hypothetical protein